MTEGQNEAGGPLVGQAAAAVVNGLFYWSLLVSMFPRDEAAASRFRRNAQLSI